MKEKRSIRLGVNIAIFFILISIFSLLFFWRKLPPQIPLFYSHPWGEDQLGQPVFLWILPGGAILTFLGSLIVGKFLTQEKLLLQIVTWGATLFSFLSFLTLFKIITLVI